jgi:hypothetical protein
MQQELAVRVDSDEFTATVGAGLTAAFEKEERIDCFV